MRPGMHYNGECFIKARAMGRARELFKRACELAESKTRQYNHGLISKAEYDEFRRTPVDEIIRTHWGG